MLLSRAVSNAFSESVKSYVFSIYVALFHLAVEILSLQYMILMSNILQVFEQ
ncbi:hypothetical protein [uncultured Methanobrevibacter sp.]|uniref:hypothetical protein n=1 Tax=uncultured Methanobrevibacter sp. TaxID=253161 RepID=UPI0025E9AA7F|nr:hypothetical protein [uncultured Methanobrevibacter sp.]